MSMFMSKEFNSLEDLYDAEKRVADAPPKMIDAANSRQLNDALQDHLTVTKRQISRLEQIFRDMGREFERETCQGINGIVD